jgi:serine/threonine-protein kinase RsbW
MPMEGSARDKDSDLTRFLDLRMRADAAAISATTDSISEALIQLDVPEEKQMEIALALQEALANAVVHGCNNDASKEVGCSLERNANGAIVITVSDPGPGFQVANTGDPMETDKLFKGSGRGVYLIRQLMDEVHFDGDGNRIKMWKY